MTFKEYYPKITELCIVDNNDTWCSYLIPDYKVLLKENELWPNIVEDHTLTIEDIGEMLKLEVEMRHAVTDKRKIVAQWLYELINSDIKPAEEAQRTELVNDMIEYLKTKDQLADKERELNAQEEKLDKKVEAKAKLPKGLNFSKRGSRD